MPPGRGIAAKPAHQRRAASQAGLAPCGCVDPRSACWSMPFAQAAPPIPSDPNAVAGSQLGMVVPAVGCDPGWRH
jgi:hypothetical protein